MYQSVQKLLEAYGYENIVLNVVGVSLGLRRRGEQGFAVVTLDETTGNLLTREQFEHISRQIRGFLQNRGCVRTQFLYLLISEEEESQMRLFGEYGNFWRIIPTRGQVMVFQDTAGEFLELRRPLEDFFAVKDTGQSRDSSESSWGNPGQGWNSAESSWENPGQGWNSADSNWENAGGYRSNFPGNWKGMVQYWKNNQVPVCNLSIVALNIVVFLITDLFLFSNGEALVDWGALGWYEVLQRGEWYRLFTSMFMHAGIDHIFSNMLVLVYLGSCLERQIGRVRYVILYLGAGLLAGFTSMGYNMILGDYTVSIGASGAIFGVMGSLLCLVIFFKEKAGDFRFRQVAVMAFFSLYGGFTGQGVDNAAHVGGFVAGFLLTILLMLPERWTKNR